jgi:hypothetical protein
MIEILDALASMFMVVGLIASLVYFIGSLIERIYLSRVNTGRDKHFLWIPRVKFQYILGYAAATSAFGFLVAFPIADRQKLIWSYALIAVSIWFSLQARMRLLRAQIVRTASKDHQ